MIVFFAATVTSSGHMLPRTSVSRKFSLTAIQSTLTRSTATATTSSRYSPPRVRRRRVERFIGIPRSLGREVLVVDRVVGAVLAESAELLVDRVAQRGVALLDREAVLLAGGVLLDDLEAAVLGVREVDRQVLQ